MSFSLWKYPSNWENDEEINSMSDTIPVMSKGIRTTLYSDNPYSSYHTVMVQKSAMFECFKTPEEWRDLSVELKQFDEQYIGTVDGQYVRLVMLWIISSRYGRICCSTGVWGTLIHKQLVVMVNKDF